MFINGQLLLNYMSIFLQIKIRYQRSYRQSLFVSTFKYEILLPTKPWVQERLFLRQKSLQWGPLTKQGTCSMHNFRIVNMKRVSFRSKKVLNIFLFFILRSQNKGTQSKGPHCSQPTTFLHFQLLFFELSFL